MKGLIMFPLLIMFLIAMFSMLGTGGNLYYNTTLPSSGTSFVNNTNTTVNTGQGQVAFQIDPVGGFIVMITLVLGVGIAAGIRALGSGLAETTVEMIIKATFFLGLWGVLSGLGYAMLSSLPILGSYIYLALTLSYVAGFVMTLRGGGSSG